MKNLFKNKKAFTLIELILVMVMIGILVLLAMPKFMGHTKEAKFTKFISNTKQIENASERYYIDNQDWPRLSDTPYTAEQITSFSQKIYDATGKETTLDELGNYYDIDYTKLSQYVKVPDDKLNYVIQNPVGNIYGLETITPSAMIRLETGSVLLDKSTLSLNLGEIGTLIATIMPTTAVNKNVVWTSSNSGIATVDNTGKVTAIGNGTATITVKTENGGYVETCVVTVNQLVTTVSVNPTTAMVSPAGTTTLTATILPTTATNKTVTWTSSNTGVVTVNSSGLVTGVSPGTATITVKSVDGNKTASSIITVQELSIIKNFSYTGNVQAYTITVTGKYKLEVWGASGANGQSTGGNGGYSVGTINLTSGESLKFYIGGTGLNGMGTGGGWNGGGNGYGYPSFGGAGGGGGTDIRIGTGDLYSRVIVAGGGGGGKGLGYGTFPGGYGGGSIGGLGHYYGGTYDGGGTQSGIGTISPANGASVASSPSFGVGGSSSTEASQSSLRQGGGGGGWYGGHGGSAGGSGAGGSGYIITSSSYKPTSYNVNSSYYMTSTQLIAGNASMPNLASGTMTGNLGNGYARITYVN